MPFIKPALRTTVLLALGACLAGTAFAAEPSVASVERLLAATQAQRLSSSVIEQVDGMLKPMFERALGASDVGPQQQIVAQFYEDQFLRQATPILREELGWKRMKEVNIEIYRRSFSQAEIDAMIAFYESPAGRAAVERMPVAAQQSADELQQRLVPLMLKLRQVAQEEVDQMAAASSSAKK